jgi:hypothetical protein
VPTDIKSLTREELEAQFKAVGAAGVSRRAIARLALRPPRDDWDAMTNLPKGPAREIAEIFRCKRSNSSASRVRTTPRRNFSGGCATIRSSKAF